MSRDLLKLSLIVLLSVLVGLTLFVASAGVDQTDLMKQGIAAFDEGKYESALGIFDRILTANPDNYEAIKYKGKILYLLHRYADALTLINTALPRAQDSEFSVDLLGVKAFALVGIKEYLQASGAVDAAMLKNPTSSAVLAELYTVQAMAQFGMKQFESSLITADKALSYTPAATSTQVQAFTIKGMDFEALRRPTEAVYAYIDALRLKPDNTQLQDAVKKLGGNLPDQITAEITPEVTPKVTPKSTSGPSTPITSILTPFVTPKGTGSITGILTSGPTVQPLVLQTVTPKETVTQIAVGPPLPTGKPNPVIIITPTSTVPVSLPSVVPISPAPSQSVSLPPTTTVPPTPTVSMVPPSVITVSPTLLVPVPITPFITPVITNSVTPTATPTPSIWIKPPEPELLPNGVWKYYSTRYYSDPPVPFPGEQRPSWDWTNHPDFYYKVVNGKWYLWAPERSEWGYIISYEEICGSGSAWGEPIVYCDGMEIDLSLTDVLKDPPPPVRPVVARAPFSYDLPMEDHPSVTRTEGATVGPSPVVTPVLTDLVKGIMPFDLEPGTIYANTTATPTPTPDPRSEYVYGQVNVGEPAVNDGGHHGGHP
ncbi:MAG TPA: tetratricopeptide repeat protein [Methanospirillum sp.]|nr:tetratricopeptide repeat protein [Methanospirillum sp.]